MGEKVSLATIVDTLNMLPIAREVIRYEWARKTVTKHSEKLDHATSLSESKVKSLIIFCSNRKLWKNTC